MWRKTDILEASKGTGAGDFADMQQAFGLNYCPHGLLAKRRLRIHVRFIKCARYDAMHIYFCHGIYAVEVFVFFRWCETQCKIDPWVGMTGYSDQWEWPAWLQRKGKAVGDLFNKTRRAACKNAGNFKSGASESLTTYRILRAWAAEVVEPVAKNLGIDLKPLFSLYALCDVLDALQLAKFGGISADRLDELIVKHLENRWAVHAAESCQMPKFHWALHLGDQYAEDGVLLDCWPTERKNAESKTVATLIKKTTSFEVSVLGRLLSSQLNRLTDPSKSFLDAVLQPYEQADTLSLTQQYQIRSAIVAGKQCRCDRRKLSQGDLIKFSSGKVAFIILCYMGDEKLYGLVQHCVFVKRKDAAATIWSVDASTYFVALQGAVQSSLIWKRQEEFINVLGY